ncbi:class I adenylate-forming enzyme family protein [Lysinibacillus macroides]|uniref:class I adenylate-forming enzyme family protein n=1 Tax=Lysinibacillus macroides TaxID=33935 RepID=UPI0030815F4F
MLTQSETVCVFCDEELESVVEDVNKKLSTPLTAVSVPTSASKNNEEWATFLSTNREQPAVHVSILDDAEILYTSGTTGYPKGALFTHQAIINVGIAFLQISQFNPQDVTICMAPMFHSAQLNLINNTAITVGMTCIVHRDFNPVQTLVDIEKYKATTLFGVPAMYNAMLNVPNDSYDLSSIRACFYGAAPMAPKLVHDAITLFGTDQFYNLCGLTEAGPGGVYLLPTEHEEKVGAGGRAMPLTVARVVNDEMEDVVPGEIGEFVLKGETIMKEYYRKPEETQKTFRDGWLLTGDLATIDADGYITIVDRKKDMIISGGENVYSVEVEQILNSYPDILEAATIGLPDEKWGETVAAIIVTKLGQSVNEAALIAFCRERLAGYKIPRQFHYVDALPRNTSGKILKYQLRDKFTVKV